MSSIAAKEVAKEVLETIGKGEKPNLGKIALKKGYTKASAKNPQQITDTKSYKEIVDPVIKKMMMERERLLDAMSKKMLSKEKYRDMTDGFDKLTKNIQLLNGGKTSNDGIEISWQ